MRRPIWRASSRKRSPMIRKRVLSPHCCRHTYVSQLQAQGVPLETIQSLTGHADVDMTEHYLHVQKEVKEDAAQKLDSLFKKGKPTLHIA